MLAQYLIAGNCFSYKFSLKYLHAIRRNFHVLSFVCTSCACHTLLHQCVIIQQLFAIEGNCETLMYRLLSSREGILVDGAPDKFAKEGCGSLLSVSTLNPIYVHVHEIE